MVTATYYTILQEIKEHIESVYTQYASRTLLYHNLAHTQSVAAAATEIANHYQLNDKEFFIVNAAAWFHDIGYFEDAAQHEEKGAGAAAAFLDNKGIPEDVVTAIKACIMATKWPQTTHNLLEEIVCDADLYHLGTQQF